MKSIGAYEAKTHLPRLLDQAAAGETFSITKHGREVARIVPPAGAVEGSAVSAAMKSARRGVRLDGLGVTGLAGQGRR